MAVVEVLLDAGASVDAKENTFKVYAVDAGTSVDAVDAGRGPKVGMEFSFKRRLGKILRNRTQGAIWEERSWF